jgi:hypothetical protein
MVAVLALIPVHVGVGGLALACLAAVVAYAGCYAIASRVEFANALGARVNGSLET